ncbi:MAG: 2-phospho-L-lactate transferase [Anaerolineaceae bacterium]
MKKVVALAGGVGGAKLAWGLAQILSPEELSIIVNTGDDFTHLGLSISPDIDTVCYTLANLANPETGWGRAGESWNCLHELEKLGAPVWFNLGDLDLALHLERTLLLNQELTLTEATNYLCVKMGIKHSVLPMCDQPVHTMISTEEMGILPFQEYFVKNQCQPTMNGVRFEGIEGAFLSPKGRKVLEQSELVIICPSNPWVSINPILGIKEVKEIISTKLVIAVSPIIGGKTIKGPAAKMYSEMGITPSAKAVAEHYGKLIQGFVLDSADENLVHQIRQCGIIPLAVNTIMSDNLTRIQLAREILNFAERLKKG